MKDRTEIARLNYWKKTRRLAHGSLACLCWESEDEADKLNLVFGVISERKESNLAKSRPTIGFRYPLNVFIYLTLVTFSCRCVPNPYNEKLITLLESSNSQKREKEVVLLQAGPSFFAFHPVLEALKNAPIPLRQYITQPFSPQGTQTLNSRHLFYILDTEEVVVGLPKYAEGDGSYNLSFLCPDITPAPQRYGFLESTLCSRFV